MPVRKERQHLYGDKWPEFSRFIRFERAEGRCECDGRCGDPHCRGLIHGRCNAAHGHPHPYNQKAVVLTVAHLNHDETCRDEDLVMAMCQRCHLAYDRDHHAANRAKTVAARKAAQKAKVRTTSAMLAFAIECRTGKRLG